MLNMLRHSFANRSLESGMNIKALSQIMGHSDVAFTLNTYVSADDDYLMSQMMLSEQEPAGQLGLVI